ncbi:MAG TPA: hypothetical protein VGN17_31170 [Bryobacteraceae bacterium]|jgi:hypothetical protein
MPEPLPPSLEAKWPLGSILIWGTFGKNSAEGRCFHRRCLGAFLFLGVGWLASFLIARFLLPAGSWRNFDFVAMYYLLVGVAFSFIAWAFWKYLGELDELARRLQLEAVALTYLTGFCAFGFLAAFGYLTGWTVNPVWFIVLEPIRAFWLRYLVRRY